ncbi:MAG: hypothetical protein Q9163_000742 [Psora crenata]
MSAPQYQSVDGSRSVTDAFLENLQRPSTTQVVKDDPDYWVDNPSGLLTTSYVDGLAFGTGEQIFKNIATAIQGAEHEIIIVTCFWAKSASQQYLADSLRHLATTSKASKRLVHVRICFSSCSLRQKLIHTQSLNGKLYPPQTWPATFGLPSIEELLDRDVTGAIGISLTIKSIFVKPFSVMHPKFIVVDRKQIFLPSCNVSWEDWFEGCVEIRGDVVQSFMRFYGDFWTRGDSMRVSENPSLDNSCRQTDRTGSIPGVAQKSWTNTQPVTTIFLPSPHHRNPRFRPTSLLSPPLPPSTPLNTFLLTMFEHARRCIYIQTPNITSPPVLKALYASLKCGVNVHIVTSTRMMVLEQLLTAGTSTETRLNSLIRRHKSLIREYAAGQDLEATPPTPGTLTVQYYKPANEGELVNNGTEPVKSHLKLLLVDEYIIVLGSGNMDRASWYTSQELGVAFFSAELAKAVKAQVQQSLSGRLGEKILVGWDVGERKPTFQSYP